MNNNIGLKNKIYYNIEPGDEITITIDDKSKTIKVHSLEIKYNLACIFTTDGKYIECFLDEISYNTKYKRDKNGGICMKTDRCI